MHLYRFFNPSAEAADSCVVFVSATNVEAINAYVNRYYPDCYRVQLSKDFNDDNAILMEESFKTLDDGRVVFGQVFAIKIS